MSTKNLFYDFTAVSGFLEPIVRKMINMIVLDPHDATRWGTSPTSRDNWIEEDALQLSDCRIEDIAIAFPNRIYSDRNVKFTFVILLYSKRAVQYHLSITFTLHSTNEAKPSIRSIQWHEVRSQTRGEAFFEENQIVVNHFGSGINAAIAV